MTVNYLAMFESLAEHGTAPEEGCSLFGVGYESAFQRLEEKYVVDRFGRGGSAEKFVVGPFGSGKTHFLRQLMEIGRRHDCVTAEVKLNKTLDYAQGLVVYQEIARQLRAPGQEVHGLRALVLDAVDRIRRSADQAGLPSDQILEAWAGGLTEQDFALPGFGRVLQRSVQGLLKKDMELFDLGLRWLSGEVSDRGIARAVGESVVSSSEIRIHAHNARLTLYKFVRYANYRGSIIGFDEAEQGIAVERKKMVKIFSHLLAEINAIIDIKDGAVLVVYAVTRDVMDKINTDMPMLQQRLADPGKGHGFFDGNVLAPTIDLTNRPNPIDELARIGGRLVDLFFDNVADASVERRGDASASVRPFAEEVERDEPSASARRAMVKRVCERLVNEYRKTPSAPRGARVQQEAEV